MSIFAKIIPDFWHHSEHGRGLGKAVYNFRRMWQVVTTLTILVALIPLALLAVIDYQISKDAIESETVLRLSRLVSNTRRSVAYFFDERVAALKYLNLSKSYESLRVPNELERTLSDLQESFGGFVDLGVIDERGVQIAYVGPYALKKINYEESEWFRAAYQKGIHVSDVFEGYRNVPHLVVAIKHDTPDNHYYVLRATLDLRKLGDLLMTLNIEGEGDVFLINHEGVLQTPSRYYGSVLNKVDLPSPAPPDPEQFDTFHQTENDSLLVGYTYIDPNNPLVLMSVKPKSKMMKSWNQSKLRIIGILLVSVVIIVVVILSGTTYLVSQIYHTDQRRLAAMHKVEYAHKMASLGRLSAGIAHEINNPLAVIGEKAGLAMDLIRLKADQERDPKIMAIIDSIVSSVDRCANITHRLLGFARHTDAKRNTLVLNDIVNEVLGFMGKEANYRSIKIRVHSHPDVPLVESDRGRLQEIFLNLFTNAFAAMNDGGMLTITIKRIGRNTVKISCTDTGCGIPESDLENIFEPFFSTTIGQGGTGLGLSITYQLVKEIGGKIEVESQVGEGTTFFITIPIVPSPEIKGS